MGDAVTWASRILRGGISGLVLSLAAFIPTLAHAAPPIAEIQKARQDCNDKAEKSARAYRVHNNRVRVSSNYNVGMRRCYIYLEMTTPLASGEGAEGAKGAEGTTTEGMAEVTHHQNWLIDADSHERLAMTMWNDPGTVHIGRIFEEKYKGPRDGFDVSDHFIRERMALIAGL
jgi:hypothetical protein